MLRPRRRKPTEPLTHPLPIDVCEEDGQPVMIRQLAGDWTPVTAIAVMDELRHWCGVMISGKSYYEVSTGNERLIIFKNHLTGGWSHERDGKILTPVWTLET